MLRSSVPISNRVARMRVCARPAAVWYVQPVFALLFTLAALADNSWFPAVTAGDNTYTCGMFNCCAGTTCKQGAYRRAARAYARVSSLPILALSTASALPAWCEQ